MLPVTNFNWLPVTFRIDFKVLLLIYKVLNVLGPSYIANSLVKYLPSRTLRSSNAVLLEVPNSGVSSPILGGLEPNQKFP